MISGYLVLLKMSTGPREAWFIRYGGRTVVVGGIGGILMTCGSDLKHKTQNDSPNLHFTQCPISCCVESIFLLFRKIMIVFGIDKGKKKKDCTKQL